VLNGVSLDIKPGEVIGIVGRSGSGKSTLTKLVQRLYTPEQWPPAGRRHRHQPDRRGAAAAAGRRGAAGKPAVQPQRAREHRHRDPAAPIEAVMRVAQLAGAHEFISELPEGYDTVVGEQGSSLSGGQRQRIAIARALFTNPRILILDEATSALDYESEAIIQRNMAHICKGRTVLIIAHRLSAVRHANRIIVMDKGKIVEAGAHERCCKTARAVRHLWSMQDGSKRHEGAGGGMTEAAINEAAQASRRAPQPRPPGARTAGPLPRHLQRAAWQAPARAGRARAAWPTKRRSCRPP
jgi:subfamily B ATP-binding cassette protein HlyB/CyaB